MARYSTDVRLEAKKVVENAIAYFGEAGLGLKIRERSGCCVFFDGGGGHVNLFTELLEKKTRVNLETREWDYQVKNFLRAL
jgi:hypothetical protein